LLYCYEGKVDVIYIDPPYNTGARDWKYNNDYVDKTDSFRHSKWLSMIRRRLLLAKRLLKPTGVLIVAIDDNEVHHLRCLVDSIFSPDLHMGTVCVRHKPGGTTTARKIARSHEYALFYAASLEVAPCMVIRTDEQLSRFKHSDDDGAFEWENFRKHGQGCRKDDRPRQHYPIWLLQNGKLRVPKMEYDDKGKTWVINELLPPGAVEVWPNKGKEKRVWLWAPENFTANPTLFKYEDKKGEHCIYKKRRPNRVGVVPNTIWSDSKYSANEHGSGMIVKIFGSTEPFDFAKSVYTVADCISVASDKKDALILDFFAGSGTTFHSTALLNSDDGGSRRCVLVANNELKESVAKEINSAGFFQGDAEYEARGIAESVTWPRCKYVINGKRDDGTPIPGEHLTGRNLSAGFEENFEYAHLDFLDSSSVARGDAFQAILPILWMMAGCRGRREDSKGSQPWFFPKQAPFAVLIKEKEFRAFREALAERKDIEWIYLVTDSQENFGLMRRTLGRKFHCVQLYKSYLENFRINTPEVLGEGGAA
jgi:adenine-specific DNA-methyltransferase